MKELTKSEKERISREFPIFPVKKKNYLESPHLCHASVMLPSINQSSRQEILFFFRGSGGQKKVVVPIIFIRITVASKR